MRAQWGNTIVLMPAESTLGFSCYLLQIKGERLKDRKMMIHFCASLKNRTAATSVHLLATVKKGGLEAENQPGLNHHGN